MENQNKQILEYLKKGNNLTQIAALKLFGCFRLSGRIYDIKKQGYNIDKKSIKYKGKTFASYFLKNNMTKNENK